MPGGRATGIATLHGLNMIGRLTTIADTAEGKRLVPLSEVPDEARLANTVMQTLGLPGRPSLPPAEADYRGQALCHGLGGIQVLVDGCEHLLRNCASLTRRLLRHCPRPVR